MKTAKEMLESALFIMNKELERMTREVEMDKLDPLDSSALNNYTKTLISYEKDQRSAAKEMDAINLTDEQLKEELKSLLKED